MKTSLNESFEINIIKTMCGGVPHDHYLYSNQFREQMIARRELFQFFFSKLIVLNSDNRQSNK